MQQVRRECGARDRADGSVRALRRRDDRRAPMTATSRCGSIASRCTRARASRCSTITAARPTFRSINGAQAPEQVAKELAAQIERWWPVALEDERAMIVCRSAAELRRLRDVNQLVGQVLEQLREAVAPGVTTADLDALAEREIRARRRGAGVQGLQGLSRRRFARR